MLDGQSTFQKFSLSKGEFSTFDLISSIVMTFLGAEIILSMYPIHRHGFFCVIVFSSISIALVLFGLFFGPKIAQKNIITMGDLMGDVWGYKAKFFYGILTVCNCSIIAALQISVWGTVLELLYPLPFYINKALSALVVIGYAFCGGIADIIKIHKLQFMILSVSLPILLWVGLSYIGGPSEFIKYFESGHIAYTPDSDYYILIFCLSCSLGVMLSPPLTQRALMAKNSLQALKSSCFAGILLVPLVVSLGIVSFIFYILMDVLCPGRSLIEAFGMIPIFLRGMVILNLLVIVISTADSALNCGTVSFINDVISSFNPNNNNHISIRMIKVSLITIGVISTCISIQIDDLLKILTYSNMLWVSILVPPLIGLIFNKKISAGEFYVCVATGGLVLLLWNIFSVDGLDFIEGIFLGFLSNALIYTFFYFKRNFSKFRIFLNKLF